MSHDLNTRIPKFPNSNDPDVGSMIARMRYYNLALMEKDGKVFVWHQYIRAFNGLGDVLPLLFLTGCDPYYDAYMAWKDGKLSATNPITV